MAKKKELRNHAKDNKHHVLLLAELTHKLTGEEETDIRGYLEKFGIEGFFARLDSLNMNPQVRTKICELYDSVIKKESRQDTHG